MGRRVHVLVPTTLSDCTDSGKWDSVEERSPISCWLRLWMSVCSGRSRTPSHWARLSPFPETFRAICKHQTTGQSEHEASERQVDTWWSHVQHCDGCEICDSAVLSLQIQLDEADLTVTHALETLQWNGLKRNWFETFTQWEQLQEMQQELYYHSFALN